MFLRERGEVRHERLRMSFRGFRLLRGSPTSCSILRLARSAGSKVRGLAYLREGPCLIRTDDRHRAERLDSLQTLTQNLVLAHDVCRNRQSRSNCDRESLRNESNGDRHTRNNQRRHTDPLGILLPYIPRPNCNKQNNHGQHQGDDDVHEVKNLLLEWCQSGFGLVGELGDAAEDCVVAGEDYDAETRPGDAVRALETDAAGFEEVGVGG